MPRAQGTPSAPDVARRIVGFVADPAGDWIVRLDCGHRRHIRHRPPLTDYPWIGDAAERAARVGAAIECERCGRGELPDDAAPYRTTGEFDETTLPAGLRRDHRTAVGVWGRAEVLAGSLRFVMPVLAIDRVIETGDHAVIPPELAHRVEPLGRMRMRVVFLRVPVSGVP